MSFLPKAWIGYCVDTKGGGFFVKVCERCPDRDRALEEARSSGLRTLLTICSSCCYESTQKRLGEHHESQTQGT